MTLVSGNIQLREVSHKLTHPDIQRGVLNFIKEVKWKDDDDILPPRREVEVSSSKCNWVLLYIAFSLE